MKKKRGGQSVSLTKRLWDKIEIKSKNECWEWQGSTTSFGYGHIGKGGRNGKTIVSHRIVWELNYGEIPKGMKICHKCDNPKCCNPRHLFIGTQADNLKDCRDKGRAKGGSLPGIKNPNAKLTEDQVKEIRELYSRGNVYQRELANKYNITQTQVGLIIREKSWIQK